MMANEMEMRDLPSMTRLVVAVVQAKLPGEKVEGESLRCVTIQSIIATYNGIFSTYIAQLYYSVGNM